jgi:twinkle protein
MDAAHGVARLFDFNKVYLVKFTKRKDANEYLENGEGDELRRIWWNSKRFIPEGIISSFSEFEKILKDPTKVGVSYPFPTLTGMTYGIRLGESVLVTAQEGVGKTEFMHSVEYHLLKETNDNVGAIYLEEGKQRHLQAIAGQHLKAPCHIPDGGVSSDEAYSALVAAVGRDERLHIYSHFGSDDPEILLDRIRFLVSACACRYILLDHLTMCVSGSGVEDERRTLDYLSTHLETMVKDLQFALIVVSHVNDAGQTRGSRYISKIADIRIDLHRDITNVDPSVRNTTVFTISKNRFCGKTGYAGKAVFDPVSYTLSEYIPDHEVESELLVRAAVLAE